MRSTYAPTEDQIEFVVDHWAAQLAENGTKDGCGVVVTSSQVELFRRSLAELIRSGDLNRWSDVTYQMP